MLTKIPRHFFSREEERVLTSLTAFFVTGLLFLALLALTKSTPPDPYFTIESFSLHYASTVVRFQVYNPDPHLSLHFLEVEAKLKVYETDECFAETKIQPFGQGSRRMAAVEEPYVYRWKQRLLKGEQVKFTVMVRALVAAFTPGDQSGNAIVGDKVVWCRGVNVVNGSSLPQEITLCH